MSTDYGFKCLDCDDTVLFDNFRGYAVGEIYASLAELSAFSHAWFALYHACGVSFYVSNDCGIDDTERLLRWSSQHGKHQVVVVDEYGSEYSRVSDDNLNFRLVRKVDKVAGK